MSRCCPYPPLGYMWRGVCGEALVELMSKVKREWAAAEKERKKERKRQRKEKRREKRKLKKKEQSSDKGNCVGWNIIDWERSDHQKKREYESQIFENFSLIEDLDRHIVSEGLGPAFYNSENFSQRKPHVCPCAFQKPHDDGKIIWADIRPEDQINPEVQSTLNRMEKKFAMDLRPEKVYFFPTNEGTAETVPMTCTTESHRLHESQLRELLENLVPVSQLSELTEFDGQEWLFKRRSVQRNTTEWSIPISVDLRHGNSTLYPYARYMPEADLHALPLTVIF